MKSWHQSLVSFGVISLFSAALLFAPASPAIAASVQTEHKGLTLNGNLQIAPDRTLADGVLLIVHAMLQHLDSEIIRGLQEGLAEAGWSSLAINLSLGINDRQGSYECPHPHTYVFDDALDEAEVWLDWLQQRGAGLTVVLGHSLGANQMLGLAVERPQADVSALILLSPMTTGYDRLTSTYEQRWRVNFDSIYRAAREKVENGRGEELMDVDFVFCPKTRVAARTFVSLYGGKPLSYDPSEHLRQIGIPTQIIIGSDDERQPNVAAFLQQFVDDKRISLYTIESGGHFFRDLNLEEAVEVTVEFLDHLKTAK